MNKLAALMVLLLALSCVEKARDELVIGCVGDSLMRPNPSHFMRLAKGPWLKTGLSLSEKCPGFQWQTDLGKVRLFDVASALPNLR